MNLSGLQFWTKASHDMLVLLNSGHARKNRAFHVNFIVVLSAGQIVNFDLPIGIILFQAFFHLFWCHTRAKLAEPEGEVSHGPP